MSPHRHKQIGAAAIVVALAASGAAVAATKLHHQSSAGLRTGVIGASSLGFVSSQNGGMRADRGHGDHLAAAAAYLGIDQSALLTQLQSGKTLAQVAAGIDGKSAAGLIAALVAEAKSELAADVTAGRLTQAQADAIAATLTDRITARVNNAGPGPGMGMGMGHGPGMGGPRHDLEDAASYLGITPAALLTQLEAGKTLAQVADATSGKSAAGLIDALVADETTTIKAAVTAGTLTQAQADELLANLKAHETAEVNGTFDHHGGGPGGPGFRGGMPMAPSGMRGTHI